MTHGRELYSIETSSVIQVGGHNHTGVLELFQFQLANELIRPKSPLLCVPYWFTCPLAQFHLTSCWDIDFTLIHKGMPWVTQ